MKQRPALNRRQLPRRARAHRRHVARVASAVRNQILARALIGQIQQRHRLRPVVPVAETQIDLAVARPVQRPRLATLPPAHRSPRIAPRVVDIAHRPGHAGDRQRLQLRHVDPLRLRRIPAPQQRRGRRDEARQPAHVARLTRGQLQRRLILVGVDVGPTAARRGRQVVPPHRRELALQPVRRDREMHRVAAQRAQVDRRRLQRLQRLRGDHKISPAHRISCLGLIRDPQRALVPVGVGVQRRALRAGPVVEEGRLGPQRMAAGRLDQRHIRAVVGEQPPRIRPRQAVRQINHPQSRKRCLHAASVIARETLPRTGSAHRLGRVHTSVSRATPSSPRLHSVIPALAAGIST